VCVDDVGNVEGAETAVRRSCDATRSPRWGSTQSDEEHVTLGRGERSGGDDGVYTFDSVWARLLN
jgi:hypothetical protein